MDLFADPGAAEVSDVPSTLDFRAARNDDMIPVANSQSRVDRSSLPRHLSKYFAQRYRLFHQFDSGVAMDEESWYSVTPEKIAAHIAGRFAGKDIILDLFSGAGGNSIQFALAGAYVIGVELSAERISLASTNACVYGVRQYIDFIQGDVYSVLPTFIGRHDIEAVFLSPPWGGPGYKDQAWFDVSKFAELVRLAKCVSNSVGILLPRNIQSENVVEYFGPCEMERNFLAHKHKTTMLYFGDLLDKEGKLEQDREQELDNLMT